MNFRVSFASSLLLCGVLSAAVTSLATKAAGQDGSPKAVREKIFPTCRVFKVQGHDAFVLEPSSPAESNRPWVFYAPTLPAYPDMHEQWMHEQFLAAGVAVAGVDVGEAYGSPQSRKIFDLLYEEMTRNAKYAAKPCLLGRSRGGLWTSAWAADHPDRFAGLAGIYPVYDFRSYPGIDKAAPAYGLQVDELQKRLSEFNPIARADRLAVAKLPVHIIHGDKDEVVPLDVNSAALKEAYTRAGSSEAIHLEVVAGQGHNFWPGFFKSQSLVDFVIARARAGAENSAGK